MSTSSAPLENLKLRIESLLKELHLTSEWSSLGYAPKLRVVINEEKHQVEVRGNYAGEDESYANLHISHLYPTFKDVKVGKILRNFFKENNLF